MVIPKITNDTNVRVLADFQSHTVTTASTTQFAARRRLVEFAMVLMDDEATYLG